jgi:hypothetical protein
MREGDKDLRWVAGVPVATNPIIALDVALAALAVWFGGTVFIGLGQALIGDGLSRASLLAALALAGYLALGLLAVFFAAGFAVLGNKYLALYRVDERGVYVETRRAAGLAKDLFHVKPFPAELASPKNGAARLVSWTEIHTVQAVPAMRALILKNRNGGTVAKLYCPTDALYEQALAAVRP